MTRRDSGRHSFYNAKFQGHKSTGALQAAKDPCAAVVIVLCPRCVGLAAEGLQTDDQPDSYRDNVHVIGSSTASDIFANSSNRYGLADS